MPPTLQTLLLLCCALWSLTASAQPQPAHLDSIVVQGNRITRTHALLRILSIQQGDTLPSPPDALLERNRQLVYNTDLFNRVDFRLDTTAGRHTLYITVEERWYMWPYLRVKLEDVTIMDWLHSPDLYRVTYSVGGFRDNLTGRMDKLRVLYGNGYKKGLMLSYHRPMMLPKPQIDGFFYLNYARQDEVNYGSLEGQVQRMRVPRARISQLYEAEATLSKRLNPWNWLGLRTGWHSNRMADTLLALNPQYLPHSHRQVQYPLLGLSFTHDSRDVRAFSRSGRKIELAATQHGLPGGGQPIDYVHLQASYRHFVPLARRWQLNYGVDLQHIPDGTHTSFHQKILISPELGPRGYESYYLTGTTLLDAKAEFLFALSPWRIYHWQNIPRLLRPAGILLRTFPLGVYPYVFADAAYLQDHTRNGMDTRYLDKMLHTLGIGLYVPYIYDNLLRLEAGVNHHGSLSFQLNFIHALR